MLLRRAVYEVEGGPKGQNNVFLPKWSQNVSNHYIYNQITSVKCLKVNAEGPPSTAHMTRDGT